MIAHVRRVSLFVAFVVAAVSAWTTTADAATVPRVAAAPQVTVTGATFTSMMIIEVYGTATCGQSGGQANLSVSGLQLLDWVYGATTTTVACEAGPVAWHVTLFTYQRWRSGDWVTVSAALVDATGDATDSKSVYL